MRPWGPFKCTRYCLSETIAGRIPEAYAEVTTGGRLKRCNTNTPNSPTLPQRTKTDRAPLPRPPEYLQRTVSAPGKVLVAGGYLVLDRPNVGVVLAATARFFSSVTWTDEKVRRKK